MKLKKLTEDADIITSEVTDKTDVREVEKNVKDDSALDWHQAEAIDEYPEIKKRAKKELSPVLDNAKELVKATAEGEKAPENIVNESKLTEEPKLEPRYDGRKSFYGKAQYEENSDGSVDLYSYGTHVVHISADGEVELLPMWNCSQTTLRHVRDFLLQRGYSANGMEDIMRRYDPEAYAEYIADKKERAKEYSKQYYADHADEIKQKRLVNATSTLGEDIEGSDIEEKQYNTGLAGVINSLIQDEWQAVDAYSGAVATLEFEGKDTNIDNSDVVEILNDIISEEMVHIGQLQKVLTLIDSNADSIKDGEAEAESVLDNGAPEEIDTKAELKLEEPVE